MDVSWLVPSALVIGAGLGVGITVFVVAAASRGRRLASVLRPGVPDGVEQVIATLEDVGAVVDASDNVLCASPYAFTVGVVRGGELASPVMQEIVDEVRSGGRPITREVRVEARRVGEVPRDFTVRSAPLGSRYTLLLADDRTDSIRLDEVRRDFIANISHELKTPIGAVGVLADAIAAAAREPDRVERFAERLQGEAERLAALTADIIDLSRLQADEALHSHDEVFIDDVVTEALDGNRIAADEAEVSLVVGDIPDVSVFGDRALLIASVQNLISNAIHYSASGSQVGVGVRSAPDDPRVVEVRVTDQGTGIPAEEHARVFERFYRVDDSRSRHTGGTGLGLSIVKHAVRSHGGEVSLWSQPGEGSTFAIRLPMAESPPESESSSRTERRGHAAKQDATTAKGERR